MKFTKLLRLTTVTLAILFINTIYEKDLDLKNISNQSIIEASNIIPL
ncbi:hypothetical protein [Brassicibacter mesophilus]